MTKIGVRRRRSLEMAAVKGRLRRWNFIVVLLGIIKVARMSLMLSFFSFVFFQRVLLLLTHTYFQNRKNVGIRNLSRQTKRYLRGKKELFTP